MGDEENTVQTELSEEFDKAFSDGFDDGDTWDAEDENTDPVKEDPGDDDDKELEDPDQKEGGEPATEKAEEKKPEEGEPEGKQEDKKEPESKEEKTDEKPDKPEKVDKEEKPPEPLRVFFLGQDIEVKPEDIPDLVQRGMNEARMEKRFKEMEEETKYIDEFMDVAAYFGIPANELIKHTLENYKRMEINKLIEREMPEEEAKELFGQRMSNARTARANQPKPKGKRDYAAEIDGLFRSRPDLRGMKEFPPEVAKEIQKGTDVKTAYMLHETRKLSDEIKTLTAEKKGLEDKLRAMEQEKKVEKAPKSQKGTGSSSTKTDPFLRGFDEDY